MAGRAVLGALAAVLLGGCGVADDRDQARTVVERFYAAVERDDGAAACRQLSPDLIEQLESQRGQACAAVVTRLGYEPGPVVEASVFVTNAVVELGSGERAFLSRATSGWRLSAIGCEPEAGKLRDRPFTCQAQA